MTWTVALRAGSMGPIAAGRKRCAGCNRRLARTSGWRRPTAIPRATARCWPSPTSRAFAFSRRRLEARAARGSRPHRAAARTPAVRTAKPEGKEARLLLLQVPGLRALPRGSEGHVRRPARHRRERRSTAEGGHAGRTGRADQARNDGACGPLALVVLGVAAGGVDTVDNAPFLRLVGAHEMVAVQGALDLFIGLAAMLGVKLVQTALGAHDVLGVALDVGRLALKTT